MKTETLMLESNLFLQPINNVSNQTAIRTFETRLTNQQFATLGLLVVDPKHNQSIVQQFLGLKNSKYHSQHPQLVQIANFESFLRV